MLPLLSRSGNMIIYICVNYFPFFLIDIYCETRKKLKKNGLEKKREAIFYFELESVIKVNKNRWK